MSVLDAYRVNPELSLLDKTRVQAQVLVRCYKRCARNWASRPLTLS